MRSLSEIFGSFMGIMPLLVAIAAAIYPVAVKLAEYADNAQGED